MRHKTVNKKFPLAMLLFGLAAATFIASWARVFPAGIVERVYSRSVFPTISHMFGLFADAVSFSWLDVFLPGGLILLIYGVRKRRWKLLAGAVSFFYLWFFWTWGLNYHRPLLTERLGLQTSGWTDPDLRQFAETAAREINRLWPMAAEAPLSRAEIAELASARVARVVFRIDGTDWRTASRLKRSVLLERWYKMAGVDGMFNPFGHEPLVIAGPYPFELPFLVAHELAHVRGVANEGEANLVALLATVASDDPRFQYSGWFHLWRYLPRYAGIKLDDGPRADLRASSLRYQANEVAMVNEVQSALLDAHLKANAVPAGLRSYSEFVVSALASQPRWKEFR
jgi:hypothetical protein